MTEVNIVIIFINMTQLTQELDFIFQIASVRLRFHDANRPGTPCFPELASCVGWWQVCLMGHRLPGAHPIAGSPYMLPRECIPGLLCNSVGSTGTCRPRRTRCGTWSAGGGCPLSLGSRQEENTFSKCCSQRTMKTSFLPATRSEQMAPQGYVFHLEVRKPQEESNHVYSKNNTIPISVF